MNEKEGTFQEYYLKKYGLKITKEAQPLLVVSKHPCTKEQKEHKKETIFLVPELVVL